MDVERKAKVARTLGYICMGLALFNLALAIMLIATGRTAGTGLFATAFGVFTMGIIMVALGKRHSKPDA